MIFKPFIMLLFLGLTSALSGDAVDQVLQGSAKRLWPGCVNTAGKARQQKW